MEYFLRSSTSRTEPNMGEKEEIPSWLKILFESQEAARQRQEEARQ